MNGKDFLRLLLIEYGFTNSIDIKTYHGMYGWIGYDITSENNHGVIYSECNCEGLMFNIYSIINFMNEHNIKIISCGTYANINMSVKDFLSDEKLKEYNNYGKIEN